MCVCCVFVVVCVCCCVFVVCLLLCVCCVCLLCFCCVFVVFLLLCVCWGCSSIELKDVSFAETNCRITNVPGRFNGAEKTRFEDTNGVGLPHAGTAARHRGNQRSVCGSWTGERTARRRPAPSRKKNERAGAHACRRSRRCNGGSCFQSRMRINQRLHVATIGGLSTAAARGDAADRSVAAARDVAAARAIATAHSATTAHNATTAERSATAAQGITAARRAAA